MLTTEGRMLLSKSKGPEAIPVLNPPRDAAAYFPIDANDPRWDAWWPSVAEMQSVLGQRGITFVLVPFPTAFQFANTDPHPNTPQQVLAQRAPQLGVDVVDLLPTYEAVCKSAGSSACDGYINLLSVDVWMHPSALGHRLAAEALARLEFK
jgi:hypothetical protein